MKCENRLIIIVLCTVKEKLSVLTTMSRRPVMKYVQQVRLLGVGTVYITNFNNFFAY